MDLNDLVNSFAKGMNITVNNYNINLNIELKLPSMQDLEDTLAYLDENDVFDSSAERRKLNPERYNQAKKRNRK